jgi:hypothetical protein
METYFAKLAAEHRTRIQLEQSIINSLGCQQDCMKIPTMGITIIIASMEEAAIGLYRDQPVSFCSGDACALDSYRKCLLLQISDQISKRTQPREFEKVTQQKCRTAESAARGILTIDFVNAQKLQRDTELSERTRELIDYVLKNIRKEVVVSYAEDLTKVDPSRKSCKMPLCGDRPCISLITDPEYKCAIGYEGEKTVITLKLVTERGGKPLANISWSVIAPSGDILAEETPAVLRLDESSGVTSFRAIARYKGRTYEQEFEARPGVDSEVEVLAR